MIIKISSEVFQLNFNEFGSCVYVLKLNEGIFLIDLTTKENKKEFIHDLQELGVKLSDIKGILLTHRHYDHIGNLDLFSSSKILDLDEIELLGINVFKTPGHTSDSVCFLYKKILFSGDTLFHNGIGRTDLPTGNESEIKKSLKFLRSLDYTLLCPGHID
jgi:glyoxylase-like metal-dependent hydrolase (beta-lactamase superfamily II)